MKKFVSFFVYCIVTTIILIAILIPAVNMTLKNENARNSLLNRLATALSGELVTTSLAVSLNQSTLDISSSHLKGNLFDNNLTIDIPKIRIKFRYADILQGSIFPHFVSAESPSFVLSPHSHRNEKSAHIINWGREGNNILENIFGHGALVDITNASVSLPHMKLYNISVRTSGNRNKSYVKLTSTAAYGKTVFPVEIYGYTYNPFGKPFFYSFDIKSENLPVNLIPSVDNFFFTDGITDFTGKIQGRNQKIDILGRMNIKDLDMRVAWTSGDKTIHLEKPYFLKKTAVSFKGSLNKREINMSSLALQNDNFNLKGSLLLNFENVNDPFFDLRVQSDTMQLSTLKKLLPDPLINDWTTHNIFPRLKKGTAIMNSLVLTGTFNEISHLDEPQFSHCLSWSGTLHDVDTYYNNHKYLGRVVSTQLAMEGDILKIRNMVAKSGHSYLKKGNMTLAGLYNPMMHLSTDINGSFISSWLYQIAKDGLIGENLKIFIEPVKDISGQLTGIIDLAMDIGKKIELKSMEGRGKTNSQVLLSLRGSDLPLQINKCSFSLHYPGVCNIKADGLWGKSTFSSSVDLIDIDKKQQLKLKIKPNWPEIINLFPNNKKLHLLAPCLKTLPVQADISHKKTTLTARGSIDLSAMMPSDNSLSCSQSMAENSLKRADYSFVYTGNKFNLKKLSVQAKQGSFDIAALLNISPSQPLFISGLNIVSNHFPLSSLRWLVPGHHTSLNGTLNGTLTSDRLWLDSIWQNLDADFNISGWKGSWQSPPLTVNNADFSVKIKDNNVVIQGRNIWLKDITTSTPLRFSAHLKKYNTWNGTLRLYNDYLDLTSLPDIFRGQTTETTRQWPIGKIKILAGVDKGVYRDLIFSPVYLQGKITPKIFLVSRFIAERNDNFIWLTGQEEGNNIIYESYFKVIKQPVQSMLALFGFDKERITGDMNIEGKLTGAVAPNETIFENLSGPLFIEMKDGILKSSSLLIKILDLISIENIFEKKSIIEWKDSFAYKSIQARFDLAGGVLGSKTFIMDAPVFDFFAEGTVDILHNTINMNGKFAPFGTVSKIITAIPYLGYIFTGKTKSLFDFSLSIKGQLDDPTINYIPLMGTIKSLAGYIKRLVTSREEIHKNVNAQVKEDMYRRNGFVQYMKKELNNLK